MTLENFKIRYRYLEGYAFIGLTKLTDKNDDDDDEEDNEIILEYLIYIFLSLFRKELKKNQIINESQFFKFDTILRKYRAVPINELESYLNTIHTSYLQDLLNKIKDYFPPLGIIRFNSKKLSLIGKDLIWVSLDITEDEKKHLIMRIKKKINNLYGPKFFESIKLGVVSSRKNIKKGKLDHNIF
jgi:hypothetical protein